MKLLIPLVDLLSRYRLKKIDILANEGSDSPYTDLFRQISNGQINTDQQAAQYLFDDIPTSERFRKFKSIFRRKLLNNVFFISGEHEDFYPLQKAHLSVQKEWMAIQILQTLGQLRLAAQLAEKLLPQAIHYELTEICLSLLSIVKHEAASVKGDAVLFEQHIQLYNQYLETYRLENLAITYYEKIRLSFVKSLAPKPALALEALTYYTELLPYLSKCTSHRLHLFVRMLQVSEALIKCDYPTVLEVSRVSILFFLQKPFLHQRALSLFYNHQLIACIHLKQYEKGWEASRQCLQLEREGGHNWYVFLSRQIQLALHCGAYQKGYQSFLQGWEHKRFKQQSQIIVESWWVFQAYFYFLCRIGQLNDVKHYNILQNFRLQRFLNNTPNLQKDKQGMNLAILIVQILILIVERKYDVAIDRIEAIEMYTYRHLHKHSPLYRVNHFIKALLELPKAGFHPVAFQRKAETVWKKLQLARPEQSTHHNEVEILPFEQIWEFLLGILIEQRPKKNSKNEWA